MAIYALGDVEPTIHPRAYVSPEAVIIGDVVLGEEASVWPHAVIRGDDATIRIGDRTSVQDGTVIHVKDIFPTTVGSDCVIGHLVHLEGCVIEDNCLIGNGSIVMDGAVIESWALVGANAVVPPLMRVPSLAMALGVPARIKPDRVNRDDITDSVAKYVARVKRYKAGLRRID